MWTYANIWRGKKVHNYLSLTLIHELWFTFRVGAVSDINFTKSILKRNCVITRGNNQMVDYNNYAIWLHPIASHRIASHWNGWYENVQSDDVIKHYQVVIRIELLLAGITSPSKRDFSWISMPNLWPCFASFKWSRDGSPSYAFE